MNNLLEKSLKDSLKEKKLGLGTKQVLSSIKNSKLIVISYSVKKNAVNKIREGAKKQKIPTLNFNGTSMALGKLCGLQFRVSTASFMSLDNANVKSILKEQGKNEK